MPNKSNFNSIEDWREWYKLYQRREDIREYRKNYIEQYRLKYGMLKDRARGKVAYALKSGKLKKQSCFCGKTKVEAHHWDYSFPLDIIWVCGLCHQKLHETKSG